MPETTKSRLLPMPKGWIKAGSHPQEYDMGIDKGASPDGTNCGCMQSIKKTSDDGFGTLMQGFRANGYRGQRLKLTCTVKTKDVNGDGWAGVWMRVDGPNSDDQSLAFDNMQDRPINGTTDWSDYIVVLDVADNADVIAFGVLLGGMGTVWMHNFRFDVVGKDVQTTDGRATGTGTWVNESAINLDFSQSED